MDKITAIKLRAMLKKLCNDISRRLNVACDLAIAALEKQIPQKPTQNENFYACPSCGAIRSIR